MHILNFHFLTVYCYCFTDNAEVKRIKMDLCILCKESIRKSGKGKNGQSIIKASKQRCDKSRSLSLTQTSIVYERWTSLKGKRFQVINQVCGSFVKQ